MSTEFGVALTSLELAHNQCDTIATFRAVYKNNPVHSALRQEAGAALSRMLVELEETVRLNRKRLKVITGDGAWTPTSTSTP